jgi:hypothetical protein
MRRKGGVAGSQPMSTVQLYTWSPNKLWRSDSIFNLCLLLFAVAARIEQVDLKTAAREGELQNEKLHYFVNRIHSRCSFFYFLFDRHEAEAMHF